MARHNDFGKWGEEVAADYLRQKGYTIVEHDWRFGRSHSDIDLIVVSPEEDEMAFVEVKTRDNEDLVAAVDAIDRKKIRRLGRAADHYIKLNRVSLQPRFDVITIVGSMEGSYRLNHMIDAFNPLLL